MTTLALHQLIDSARQELETEAARQLQICNACRYCEGFCAVFPAMTRRLDFLQDDVHYLANLCHNCGACLHACQYAPPHEFAVNIPKVMAEVRGKTYSTYAWPACMGKAYERNGLLIALSLAVSLALIFWLAVLWNGSFPKAQGANFYAVFPHNVLVVIFGSSFGFALFSAGMSLKSFWKAQNLMSNPEIYPVEHAGAAIKKEASIESAKNALSLKYLDGGHGEGCHNANERWTKQRRTFHHFTFYGFALCFASTSVATLYHYLFALKAPYAYTSLPVILGTLGGIGLLIGPLGLFALKMKRHPLHGDTKQNAMDYGFIALLFFTSLSGLALLGLRETSAMPALLCVHLGCVLAFFITLPYSKMMHGVYRSAALLKFSIEKRMPLALKLGGE